MSRRRSPAPTSRELSDELERLRSQLHVLQERAWGDERTPLVLRLAVNAIRLPFAFAKALANELTREVKL